MKVFRKQTDAPFQSVAFRTGKDKTDFMASFIHRRRIGEQFTFCGAPIPQATYTVINGLQRCSKCFKRHGISAKRKQRPSDITSDEIARAVARFEKKGGMIEKLRLGAEDPDGVGRVRFGDHTIFLPSGSMKVSKSK